MKALHIVVVAVVCGILITLLTGLMPSTPFGLVGASWYGYPLTWLIRRVLAPQYNPWYPKFINLVFDIVFWSVVTAMVMFLSKHSKSSNGTKRRRGRR
jgi:hypothetical protein